MKQLVCCLLSMLLSLNGFAQKTIVFYTISKKQTRNRVVPANYSCIEMYIIYNNNQDTVFLPRTAINEFAVPQAICTEKLYSSKASMLLLTPNRVFIMPITYMDRFKKYDYIEFSIERDVHSYYGTHYGRDDTPTITGFVEVHKRKKYKLFREYK